MNKSKTKQLKAGDGAKLPAKPEEKSLKKPFTVDEVRNIIKEDIHLACDPDYVLKDATKKFNAWMDAPTDKEAGVIKKDMMEVHDKALLVLGLETHYPLADMVSQRYRGLAIEVARQLEKEYDCKASSERLLAQTTAGIYIKIIEYSRQLMACTQDISLSNEKNSYYSMISKELDRAHRQLITALTTLRQIKNPPIELNVKAKTAFVAQNQQINAVNNLENRPAEQQNPT